LVAATDTSGTLARSPAAATSKDWKAPRLKPTTATGFMRPVAGWGRHATAFSGLYLGGAGWLAAERLLGRV